MKRSREEAYDKLYGLAVRVLAKMDACNKCPISKGCNELGEFHYSKKWCCSGCPHAGPTGCTVEALACRLWLCDPESGRQYRRNNILRKRLAILRNIAVKYDLYLARGNKEETLEHGHKGLWWLYYHSHKQGLQHET